MLSQLHSGSVIYPDLDTTHTTAVVVMVQGTKDESVHVVSKLDYTCMPFGRFGSPAKFPSRQTVVATFDFWREKGCFILAGDVDLYTWQFGGSIDYARCVSKTRKTKHNILMSHEQY